MPPASSIARRDKNRVLVGLVCHASLFHTLLSMNLASYILLETMVGSTHGTVQLLLASVPIMTYLGYRLLRKVWPSFIILQTMPQRMMFLHTKCSLRLLY